MIKILCVGKIKEHFLKEAIKEYEKRLTKYTKLKIVEGIDFDLGDPISNLQKEKEFFLKEIGEKDFVITLEIEGKELSSIEFSKKLEELEMNYHNLVFVIGGSNGIHEEVKKRSNYKLSFSKMTFPHQLFRVILLEQIYRAYKIKNHETYHK